MIWSTHWYPYREFTDKGTEFVIQISLVFNLASFLFGIKHSSMPPIFSEETLEVFQLHIAFLELKIVWGTHPEIVEIKQ
jgi:hypothetical protein